LSGANAALPAQVFSVVLIGVLMFPALIATRETWKQALASWGEKTDLMAAPKGLVFLLLACSALVAALSIAVSVSAADVMESCGLPMPTTASNATARASRTVAVSSFLTVATSSLFACSLLSLFASVGFAASVAIRGRIGPAPRRAARLALLVAQICSLIALTTAAVNSPGDGCNTALQSHFRALLVLGCAILLLVRCATCDVDYHHIIPFSFQVAAETSRAVSDFLADHTTHLFERNSAPDGVQMTTSPRWTQKPSGRGDGGGGGGVHKTSRRKPASASAQSLHWEEFVGGKPSIKRDLGRAGTAANTGSPTSHDRRPPPQGGRGAAWNPLYPRSKDDKAVTAAAGRSATPKKQTSVELVSSPRRERDGI